MKIDPLRLRELCAKGLNAHQIGTRLGVTSGAVHLYCKRHGITVAAAPHGKTGVYFASRA